MTDKLRAAAEMAQDACPYTNKELRGAFYEGFIKALDQLPDNTKMIEPIGEIVEAHGLIAVSIPEMPPVGTKLYAEPPKHVVNLYTSEKHVYKSDKIKHDGE